MTPDAERLVADYLLSRAPVMAIVDNKVFTEIPGRDDLKRGPWVLITFIGAAVPFSRPLWLEGSTLQIDCYGGPKVLARELVDTVRQQLDDDDFVGVHDQGVVTGVDFGLLQWQPDDRFQPSRRRYLADVTVWAHPDEHTGS